MIETIFGFVQIFFFFFLICKTLTKIGKACGVSEVKSILGESLAVGSGSLSSHRKD